MTDTLAGAALGAVFGAILAAAFLAILWLSVRNSLEGGRPVWMLGGMLARLALIGAAGYAFIVSGAGAAVIIGAALGFTVVRVVVVARTRSSLR